MERPKKLRGIVAYEGTRYCGFQTQPNGPTIQAELQKALTTIAGAPIFIRGASRTDSGVHALGQNFVFESHKENLEPRRWLAGLNATLPQDIRVASLDFTDEEFHPILSAKSKAYCYRFWKRRCYVPMLDPYVWSVKFDFSAEKIRQALPFFLGRHDFTSFCAQDTTVKTRHRNIYDIRFVEHSPYYEVWILGSGFLKQMVRIIIGTLVEIGLGNIPADDIARILEAKDRKQAGQTAPACGLMLHQIFYEDVQSLDQVFANSHFEFRFPMF